MIEFRKEFFANERDDDLNEIGKPTRRQDILGHVTGRSPFFDDHQFDGLLHLRCVRSPHHHARIRRVDASQAEKMPGVVRVLTGKDVPANLNTLLSLLDFGIDDEPILSDKKVAYRGEPVAAVIAATEAQARAAVKAVRVDWEVLPHVLDVEEAIKPGAPKVLDIYPNNKFVYHGKYDHQKLRFGDVEAAFASADHIVEGRYQMSPIEQAPIETCGAIAAPEQNGRYVCYTSTQALFFSLGTAAKVLQTPSSKLHFVGGTVGGGFGGKVDSIHEPLAILGAMLTGRPVKYAWDREEEMQVGAPRGAERWYIKDAVNRDGRITARKFIGYFDSGAYTRLSSYAIIKGVGHLPGPYTIPNVYADVYCVYTNRTPATAMRGFGITGVDFAIETHMDKVAETVGLNPIELRILNSYRDGDMKAHRREAKNCALVECCQVVAEKAGVTLSAEAKAATSMTGGGGERARIPNYTATDQNGRVEGFDTGSYARKGGGTSPVSASAPPNPQPARAPQPASPPPSAKTPEQAPPRSGPPPQPPGARPAASRSGAMRFSSLAGFRRR
ncbi:aldehyde oxidase/xanthine dehydrogenase-like protein [Hoeflea halophila]|uniref:Aldehyde oxidase/xanthine dehydrogenase-like protein n=1 Tax=Hoeflea halophila TaxID=714899 RepID=A0A286IAZ5_9HYPH|nr:molybdopterin cofactor-binding domain-containing protein [Hoeflea halophila]SOE17241.1 aldehyde oxidase/xanthine dehydrogenase-like protein [Hoeflea halophila]